MTVSSTPRRPRSDADEELGFTKAKPVHWLSPLMLINTAAQVLLSNVFGEYLDKRDLQDQLPSTIFAEGTSGEEFWFDFVADLGDGFNSTYTIAYLLAQDSVTLDGEPPLRRGQMLVMGGDEVYPTPSWQRYGDKTKGPYAAAMPIAPVDGPQPNMYALPGNHDWYDGLTSFMRLFAKNGNHHVGGWCNRQARSYFAIELPQRWWLFAIDTQFGAYLDDAQLAYFHEAAAKLAAGDKVILCTPTPSWAEAVDNPGAYDSVDYFVRTVLNPVQADVKLMLSGDLHHYAHYAPTEGNDRHLIHCGGGGAYLYPTHRMPEQIPVPPPRPRTHKPSEPTQTYDLHATFPTKARSRRYAAGVFGRVPRYNAGFVGMLGVVQTLFMCSLLGLFEHASELTEKWLVLPIALMSAVFLAAAIFYAKSPTDGTLHAGRRFVLGSLHGLVQIGIGVLGTWAWASLGLSHNDWPWPIPAALIYLVVMGFVATMVFCAYMLFASTFGINLNELFSGQSIIDAKSFLRLHIDRDGTLTIHPIAVDKVSRKWRATPGAAPSAPWLEPAQPIKLKLAEPPIVIR
ncbi:MAG TPA: metallophosphoesterase [Micromonosporaceae bacterium]|jgi:hypothetical protein